MLLPDENREVLQTLLYFLSDVTAAVKENQMTPTNLAVCLAPSLFHLNTLKRENSSPRYGSDEICTHMLCSSNKRNLPFHLSSSVVPGFSLVSHSSQAQRSLASILHGPLTSLLSSQPWGRNFPDSLVTTRLWEQFGCVLRYGKCFPSTPPSALCDVAIKLPASKGSWGFADLKNWMGIRPLLPWLLQSQQSQAPSLCCKL